MRSGSVSIKFRPGNNNFFEKKNHTWSSHQTSALKNSQNSQEKTSAKASFLIKLQDSACNLTKKEVLAQVFS